MHKRGMSQFSVENFLSQSTEKLRRGILLCFINFGYRKRLWIGGGGGGGGREYQDSPLKIFVSKC